MESERQTVVRIAHEYLRTPYHPNARIKGAGVDCLTLIEGIFTEAGLIERPHIPHYPHDWHLHRDEERYLEGLLNYTHEIFTPPQPGDIALWKFGRCFSHGALVVKWPQIIHAYVGRAVTLETAEADWLRYMGKQPRPVRFFSYWS